MEKRDVRASLLIELGGGVANGIVQRVYVLPKDLALGEYAMLLMEVERLRDIVMDRIRLCPPVVEENRGD